MTKRETILSTLNTMLTAAFPSALVKRNLTFDANLPAGGLVILRDGETIDEEKIMSPLMTGIIHQAYVELHASSETARDTLVAALSVMISANRNLSGNAEWSECASPEYESDLNDSGNSVHSAQVSISISYTVVGDGTE